MNSIIDTGAARQTEASVGLREWIRDHDEKWLFVVLYLGLAVGLSLFVSLFWLVAVAAVHFVLELLRQSQLRSSALNITLHALWEIKIDVGLILLALALVVYMDAVLGLLGLQSAARAAAATRVGAKACSRAAAWERNLRTFLLTIDEMARIAYAALMLRRRCKAAPASAARKRAGHVEGQTAVAAWQRRWSLGDRIGVALVLAGLFFIAVGPVLTPHDVESMLAALRCELQPLPST